MIQNFERERKNDAILCLPPFYSHIGGYKMCLVVCCNGYREAKGNHLTVLVSVLRGKYDHLLDWPLNCSVMIQIKKIFGAGTSVQHGIEVKGQNRVFEDNCLNFLYRGDTKTLRLASISSYLNNGSLTIDVSNVNTKAADFINSQ